MRDAFRGMLVCLLFLAAPACFAETDNLTLELGPSLGIPFGESASLFDMGYGAGAGAEYKLPFLPRLSLRAKAGYLYPPIQTKDAVSPFLGGGGLGVNVPMGRKFFLSGHATAGYYYGIITEPGGDTGGNAYMSVGLGLGFSLLPTLSLQAGVSWLKGLSLLDSLGVTLQTVSPVSRQREIAAEKPRLRAPPQPRGVAQPLQLLPH